MHIACETIEDALKLCVDALGGPKVVGCQLRPELHPRDAQQWMSHCLGDHAQKPSLAQVLWILRAAKACGFHEGAEALNHLIGYRITAVIDEREAVADLARQAKQKAEEASALTHEMLARAEALHLNVDAVRGR